MTLTEDFLNVNLIKTPLSRGLFRILIMEKILNCEMLELGHIFNDGVIIKMHEVAPVLRVSFDMGPVVGGQMHFGIDDKGTWFLAYNYKLYLSEHGTKWWYQNEYRQ